MKFFAYKIEIVEHDRWSGPKTDDWMVCLTPEDTKLFEEEYNSQNTEPTAPEWYIQVEGSCEKFEITDNQYKYLTVKRREYLSILKNH